MPGRRPAARPDPIWRSCKSSTSIRWTSSSASFRCSIFSQQNLELGAAIQRAVNEWQLACWSGRDPRLKASILVGQDDTEAAVAEIERCAKTGQYLQINVSPRANEPLGRHRYWPIYARAEELGLPLGIHVGGY